MTPATRRTLMASWDTGGRDDHTTPPEVLRLVRAVLASIDLDPCSNSWSIVEAREAFDLHGAGHDGLALPWRRRADGSLRRTAFVNPPYGRMNGPRWAAKIADEARDGLEIVALVAARTDSEAFQRYYLDADALCFWRGRVRFGLAGATQDPAPFPSAVVYHGRNVARFAEVFGERGVVVQRRP